MTPEQLLDVAQKLVSEAQAGEEIEVACAAGQSTTVRVYEGDVESFTTATSAGVGVRVIRDGREGFASAGSLDPHVLAAVLEDARDNANFAEADEWAGVAQPDGVVAQEVDVWREDLADVTAQQKIEIALDVERRLRNSDPRITGVRTAAYGDSADAFALASTSGITATTRSTGSSLSIQALAVDGERTQTGYAWDAARHPSDLDTDFVVERARSQTVDLLGASKPPSAKVSLVLEPRLAATIVGLVAGTLAGDRVLKGRSPFVGRVGERIAADALSFADDPTDLGSLGADSHDGEGLACRRNQLVTNGVLDGFYYDAYNARRAGVSSTGSATRGTRGLPSPGVLALSIAAGSGGSLADLIGQTQLGVMVFSLAGLHSGVNAVSGDFSVGVEGRMIRNGELAEPISECTVASTLQRMLLDITAVGSDATYLPSAFLPQLWLFGMSASPGRDQHLDRTNGGMLQHRCRPVGAERHSDRFVGEVHNSGLSQLHRDWVLSRVGVANPH